MSTIPPKAEIMATDLSNLSVEEIRQHFGLDNQPISTHVLNSLKRDPRRGVHSIYQRLRKRYQKECEERVRVDRMLNLERVLWQSGIRHIAGVDEAGVGPLAGPVVAAAIVFPPDIYLPGVDDSKRIAPEQRNQLAHEIQTHATGIGIGIADVAEIDRLNIYHAALLAMRRAVEALPFAPQHVLVDARTIPTITIPQNPFNKGDRTNFSIAAASIIAKTHRDALMREFDAQYPGYGFASHSGYGTAQHRQAIRSLGICAIHRKSFPVIRELCGEYSQPFYALRQRLERIHAAGHLHMFEQQVKNQWMHLSDLERRKLKQMISRRWKTLQR